MLKLRQGIDIRDTMLEAQAEVAEIVREVFQELALPQMVETFRRTWMQMSEKQRKQFQQEKPEEYKALMELFQ